MRLPVSFTRITLLCLAGALLAVMPAELTAQKGQNKGGGKGGGGTESLAPVSLGSPADIGCSSTEVYRVSFDGSFAVGMANGCGPGIYNQPFTYTASSQTLGLLGDGSGIGSGFDVSETGLAVGWSWLGPAIFDVDTTTALPLPDGFTPGQPNAITDDGLLVAGYACTPNGASYAFVWFREGDDWVAEQIEDSASAANAIVAYGNEYRIVGSADGQAVMWTGEPGGPWTRRDLAPGRSRAADISADGTVIVGTHWLPYDTHVAWVEDTHGGWIEQVLKGADPSFDEGRAFGVGQLADGSIVAAGFSWQNSAGPGGTKWAVAWRLDSRTATFGAPILLPPVSKKWGAVASDVSPTGDVFGTASTGNGHLAVKWALPK